MIRAVFRDLIRNSFAKPPRERTAGVFFIKRTNMESSKYKYIYGPVSSWRIGRSLGIDPISSFQKTCTFDCIYCQSGRTEVFSCEREVFVPTDEVIRELRSVPDVAVDYITFAGNGEPTLAKNLGEMIRAVRMVRSEKIAVITNASLIDRKDVQQDLLLADRVEAKLDAASPDSFKKVNRPMFDVIFENILQGLSGFRKIYKGQLVIQAMFTAANKAEAPRIAAMALEIRPDEIEINTPLRVSPAKPLPPEDIAEITAIFRKACGDRIKVRSVYEAKLEESRPFSRPATERRRGKENL